jgi:hypothetical protein
MPPIWLLTILHYVSVGSAVVVLVLLAQQYVRRDST